MVVNYKLGKIYVLRSHQTDKIYIGSTVQKLLSTRLGGHKRKYKQWVNGKCCYITSFELLKYEDCYIELLQEYSCENKHQLHKKEGEYIRKMDCVNKNIAGRKWKEYKKDNKEKIRERHKQYREDNKEELREKRREYHKKNKTKIREKDKQYYNDNKKRILEYHKEYRKDNKEKITEQNKQYRKNNKEEIREKQRQYHQENKERVLERSKQYYQKNREKKLEKITCECGCVVSRGALSRHFKSLKHQNFLNN